MHSIDLSIKNGAYTHIYTTISSQNISHVVELIDILSDLKIVEHRINLIKPKGRVKAAPVAWKEIHGIITSRDYHHLVTIKKEEQPFLFVSCRGILEIKNV